MINNKGIVLIGIVLCLYMSSESVYRAFQNLLPIGEPGECLEAKINNKLTVKIEIVANDTKNHTSSVMISMGGLTDVRDVSFADLKQYDFKKVNCNENN